MVKVIAKNVKKNVGSRGVVKGVLKSVRTLTKSRGISKAKKINPLNVLFDKQMKHLEFLEYPKSVIDLLKEQKENVLSRANNLGLTEIISGKEETLIPFLPVVPENNVSFDDQFLKTRKNKGVPSISNMNRLNNPKSENGEPYFILELHIKTIPLEKEKKGILPREVIMAVITHCFKKLPNLTRISDISGNYFILKKGEYKILYNTSLGEEEHKLKELVITHVA